MLDGRVVELHEQVVKILRLDLPPTDVLDDGR